MCFNAIPVFVTLGTILKLIRVIFFLLKFKCLIFAFLKICLEGFNSLSFLFKSTSSEKHSLSFFFFFSSSDHAVIQFVFWKMLHTHTISGLVLANPVPSTDTLLNNSIFLQISTLFNLWACTLKHFQSNWDNTLEWISSKIWKFQNPCLIQRSLTPASC